MFISMQGPWKVKVKSNEGGVTRRFVISGTGTGADGAHSGAAATPANLAEGAGHAWSISIQSKQGGGYVASDTQIKFPTKVGGNYQFNIESNDAGSGPDPVLDDLILTCSTPATINDFIVYGHVSLYSGRCIFNPCWTRPYLIDTYAGLVAALRNPHIGSLIQKLYPERVPVIVNPNPPDPAPYFKPIVLDLFNDAMQPKQAMVFSKNEPAPVQAKGDQRAKASAMDTEVAADSFTMMKTIPVPSLSASASNTIVSNSAEIMRAARAIDGLFSYCPTENGSNLTLTFEQYNRTGAELAGGPYTGDGNRDQLGNSVTDKNGNYIFRFNFDYWPELGDLAAGENFFTAIMPDVIVKEVSFNPNKVNYESAPYWNIPNLKRIDICMPESAVQVTSTCFNGNLIGQLGDVFIGGDQNTGDSTAAPDLIRDGLNNYLGSNGTISVHSTFAGFDIECAAWAGRINIKGCMYDDSKPLSQNNIEWYTLKIRRDTSPDWTYVHESYLFPRFSKIHLSGYNGDPVGPFYPSIAGSPVLNGVNPAYMNIQRQVHTGVDWLHDSIDCYMQLHTDLYDTISGVRTPGTFYLQVDGFDGSGAIITTDLIPLYIHNLDLNFQLTGPVITDPSVVNAGCGLYRLTDAQQKTPVQLQFMANDPLGFVDNYELYMTRCPSPMIGLDIAPASVVAPGYPAAHGDLVLYSGSNAANVHPGCPGYTGTLDTFSTSGLVTVDLVPAAAEDGWLRSTEYFTVYSFGLIANKRVTNGETSGLSNTYPAYGQIMMERLNP